MLYHLKKSGYIFLLAIVVIFSFSCRKDKLLTDPSALLKFSLDTVLFDTVFTTIGSTTKRLLVYNTHNKSILISSIQLAGGKNSNFRINVDGLPGDAQQIKIRPKDSLYIFIEVTVDPNNTNSPFVISDSILFITNGNKQDVDLVAWGQNAIYYTPKYYQPGLPPYSIIECNATWNNVKPYVVYGYAVVDSACTLTIEQGTKIHFHRNAGLWVYRGGRIVVNGTKENPVEFRGDRLEWTYNEKPGQWDRIWINEGSSDNVFNYAIIKNAYIGLQIETLPFGNASISNNKCILKNTRIQNCSGAGILARNYKIEGANCLIERSGEYNFIVAGGGEYDFRHCTFANYWKEGSRQTPAIFLQNYFTNIFTGSEVVKDISKCNFYNCIITGSLENEFSTEWKSGGNINYLFHHSVIKTTVNTSTSSFVNIIKNPSGDLFKNYTLFDYHLSSNSSAINIGDPTQVSTGLEKDLDDVNRLSSGNPDAGCYEYVP
ncbi:hypothetical protein FLAV_02315 [Flavobacteriales bacterium]|nr:hypothetical protein FLAV_02315 [Flavobacteriales bacterium]